MLWAASFEWSVSLCDLTPLCGSWAYLFYTVTPLVDVLRDSLPSRDILCDTCCSKNNLAFRGKAWKHLSPGSPRIRVENHWADVKGLLWPNSEGWHKFCLQVVLEVFSYHYFNFPRKFYPGPILHPLHPTMEQPDNQYCYQSNFDALYFCFCLLFNFLYVFIHLIMSHLSSTK